MRCCGCYLHYPICYVVHKWIWRTRANLRRTVVLPAVEVLAWLVGVTLLVVLTVALLCVV